MNKMTLQIDGVTLTDERIVGSLVEVLSIDNPDDYNDVGFLVQSIIDGEKLVIRNISGRDFTINKSEIIKLFPVDPNNEGEFIGL